LIQNEILRSAQPTRKPSQVEKQIFPTHTREKASKLQHSTQTLFFSDVVPLKLAPFDAKLNSASKKSN
jgi:hypothetical protein